ncbi:MAG TPA: PfkB family carbohydrate kinase [Telluria sp.]|nr:PfkB family carbohydrate kinase [Telluria sp.]
MTDLSKKDQLFALIRANPFISQQDLAAQLGLSRSAVAGHIAGLIRERRLLGRAYVMSDSRPIACIGAANLDRKLRSLATLTMGTSNPARQDESFGGVARNIAENLARLGAPVALTTAIGDDSSGQALLAHAEAAGIDTRGALRLERTCSGTYTAVLDDHGQMLVALADMALFDAITPDFLANRRPRALAALTVADLNLPLETVAALLDEARREPAPLVVIAVSQPKMARLPQDLRGLRLLILNHGELETRIGAPIVTDADFAAACAEVRAQGAQDVIVTRGAAGVLYTRDGGGIGQLAATDAQIVDVTGAGDAFSAAVCWSLFHGSEDLELACRRGLKLSAMTLECEETVCPTLGSDTLDDIDSPAATAQPFNALYQE